MLSSVTTNRGCRQGVRRSELPQGRASANDGRIDAFALGVPADSASAWHQISPLWTSTTKSLPRAIPGHGRADLAAAGAVLCPLARRRKEEPPAGFALTEVADWDQHETQRDVRVQELRKRPLLRIPDGIHSSGSTVVRLRGNAKASTSMYQASQFLDFNGASVVNGAR